MDESGGLVDIGQRSSTTDSALDNCHGRGWRRLQGSEKVRGRGIDNNFVAERTASNGRIGRTNGRHLPPGGPTDLIPPTVPPGTPAGPTQKAPQGTPPIVNEIKNALADGNITTEQADAIRQKAIVTLGENHPTVQLIDQAILDHAAKADLPPGMADGMRLAEEAQKAAGSDTVEIRNWTRENWDPQVCLWWRVKANTPLMN